MTQNELFIVQIYELFSFLLFFFFTRRNCETMRCSLLHYAQIYINIQVQTHRQIPGCQQQRKKNKAPKNVISDKNQYLIVVYVSVRTVAINFRSCNGHSPSKSSAHSYYYAFIALNNIIKRLSERKIEKENQNCKFKLERFTLNI